MVAFGASGLCRQVSFAKPFNPILGETVNAEYTNGYTLACEQLSHHPPVSAYQLVPADGGFEFYGHAGWSGKVYANTVKGFQLVRCANRRASLCACVLVCASTRAGCDCAFFTRASNRSLSRRALTRGPPPLSTPIHHHHRHHHQPTRATAAPHARRASTRCAAQAPTARASAGTCRRSS